MTIEEYLSYLKETLSNHLFDTWGNMYTFDKTRGGVIVDSDTLSEEIYTEEEFRSIDSKTLEILR